MSKVITDAPAKKVWSKPELTKLGKISDVAGPSGVGTQSSNLRS